MLDVKWGDLKITHRWPYGCWQMDWNVLLKPWQRIPDFAAGALVEARMGSGRIWAGKLARPDWSTGAMSAVGAAREGEEALCLSTAGETSSTPDDVVDEAIARGALSWTRRVSLDATPFAAGDSTVKLNYVTALLDAWATSMGLRWGVGPNREVYAAADPVKPTIYMRPGTGVLGVSEETLAARVFGRHEDLTGTLHTVDVGTGAPEVGISLLKHGLIDNSKAVAIITGIRAQLQERTGWTNGVTVTADQVTGPGGNRMGLDQAVAGKMGRLIGLRDERGADAHTDIVLGETIWDVPAGTVAANPVGLSDRSLTGIVEAGGGELT